MPTHLSVDGLYSIEWDEDMLDEALFRVFEYGAM